MRVPTLLPDEIFRGYLGRLRRANLIRTDVELGAQLGIGNHDASSWPISARIARILLGVLGLDANTLVSRHSLVPLTKAVADFDLQLPEPPHFGAPWYLKFATWHWQTTRLCRACIAEDESYWGFSYWRRSHQYPGVSWCLKHEQPLAVTSNWNAFNGSPKDALNAATDLSGKWVDDTLRFPALQRYAAVLNSIADNAFGPVHAACAAGLVRSRAKERQLQMVRCGHKHYLSDEAANQLPESWLLEHFPTSAKKRPNEFAQWIDAAALARTQVSTAAYAIALALLWDDADKAVSAFLAVRPDTIPPRPRNKASTDWSQESMQKLWLKHSACSRGIANEIGVCQKQVLIRFRDSGLPAIGTAAFKKTEVAVEQFFGGQSLTEASFNSQVPQTMIELMLRVIGAARARSRADERQGEGGLGAKSEIGFRRGFGSLQGYTSVA